MMKYSKFLFSKDLLPVSCSTPPVSKKLHQQTTVLGDHTGNIRHSWAKRKQSNKKLTASVLLPCHAQSHVALEDTESKEATYLFDRSSFVQFEGPLEWKDAWTTAWTPVEVKKRSSLAFAI